MIEILIIKIVIKQWRQLLYYNYYPPGLAGGLRASTNLTILSTRVRIENENCENYDRSNYIYKNETKWFLHRTTIIFTPIVPLTGDIYMRRVIAAFERTWPDHMPAYRWSFAYHHHPSSLGMMMMIVNPICNDDYPLHREMERPHTSLQTSAMPSDH